MYNIRFLLLFLHWCMCKCDAFIRLRTFICVHCVWIKSDDLFGLECACWLDTHCACCIKFLLFLIRNAESKEWNEKTSQKRLSKSVVMFANEANSCAHTYRKMSKNDEKKTQQKNYHQQHLLNCKHLENEIFHTRTYVASNNGQQSGNMIHIHSLWVFAIFLFPFLSCAI